MEFFILMIFCTTQHTINLIKVELRSVGLETTGNPDMVEAEETTPRKGDVHVSGCIDDH